MTSEVKTEAGFGLGDPNFPSKARIGSKDISLLKANNGIFVDDI